MRAFIASLATLAVLAVPTFSAHLEQYCHWEPTTQRMEIRWTSDSTPPGPRPTSDGVCGQTQQADQLHKLSPALRTYVAENVPGFNEAAAVGGNGVVVAPQSSHAPTTAQAQDGPRERMP